LVLAAIGIILWGLVSYFFNLRLGLVGVLIGFMVGAAMQVNIKGQGSYVSGLVAVIITAAAIFCGELLSLILSLSKTFDMGLIETAKLIDYRAATEIIKDSFGFKSVIIYGFSLYQAFKVGSSPSRSLDVEKTEKTEKTDDQLIVTEDII